MLGYFVEDLIHKQKYDVGLSISKRNDLINKGFIKKDDIREKMLPYFGENPEKTYKYIPNNLFDKDSFGPTEEVIGEAEAGTYWHLSNFDMADKVIWVDDVKSDVFKNAC